jgi:hypothetical protein
MMQCEVNVVVCNDQHDMQIREMIFLRAISYHNLLLSSENSGRIVATS